MEEQLSPFAVTHLLQHTLRSLCIHENSQWVYAVFWRILPRNYPPPKWDGQGAYDRSRGNRRNWILVWEDGFCNFAASTAEMINNSTGDCPSSSSSVYGNCEIQQYQQGLQPDLFFKMSHEIYNYGEGLVGKVAADHSHKWIYKEPNDHHDTNILSAWHNSADSHPRTWEAQFQSGIKTIALVAVREGVVQLGAVHKVVEDLSYVVLLRKKFSYIESIPGVLLPHPSSSPFPLRVDSYGTPETWHYHHQTINNINALPPTEFYDHFNQIPYKITPSMSSLEALLSKLPSVMPPSSSLQQQEAGSSSYCIGSQYQHHQVPLMQRPLEFMGTDKVAKEEVEDDHDDHACGHEDHEHDGGDQTSSSLQYHHYDHRISRSNNINNNGDNNNGFYE